MFRYSWNSFWKEILLGSKSCSWVSLFPSVLHLQGIFSSICFKKSRGTGPSSRWIFCRASFCHLWPNDTAELWLKMNRSEAKLPTHIISEEKEHKKAATSSDSEYIYHLNIIITVQCLFNPFEFPWNQLI